MGQSISLSFLYHRREGIILVVLERLTLSTLWISWGSLKTSYIWDFWKTFDLKTLDLNLPYLLRLEYANSSNTLPTSMEIPSLKGVVFCFTQVPRPSQGRDMSSNKTMIINQLQKPRQGVQLRRTLPVEIVCWVDFFLHI